MELEVRGSVTAMPVQLSLPLNLIDLPSLSRSEPRQASHSEPPVDIRGWYNGWNWNQRRAVTPIQNAAVRSSELIRPTVCSICGFSDPANLDGRGYIFMHLEDYSDPIGGVLPACKRCHYALHARFWKPGLWLGVVQRNEWPGAWFSSLAMQRRDMLRPFGETYPHGMPHADRRKNAQKL